MRKKLITQYFFLNGVADRFGWTACPPPTTRVADLTWEGGLYRAYPATLGISPEDRLFLHVPSRRWLRGDVLLSESLFADHDCVAVCSARERPNAGDVVRAIESAFGAIYHLDVVLSPTPDQSFKVSYSVSCEYPLYALGRDLDSFLRDDSGEYSLSGLSLSLARAKAFIQLDTRWIHPLGSFLGPSIREFGVRDGDSVVIVPEGDRRTDEVMLRLLAGSPSSKPAERMEATRSAVVSQPATRPLPAPPISRAAAAALTIPAAAAAASKYNPLNVSKPALPSIPRDPAPITSAADPSAVKCSVFAPPTVKRAQPFMVQVFAHTSGQASEVDRLAREFDQRSARRAVTSLLAAVDLGTMLTFHLSAPGAIVTDPVWELLWNNEPESVQFGVELPTEFTADQLLGTVRVSVAGVPVGHVKFTLSVGTVDPPSGSKNVGVTMQRYRLAFVSYASADRQEVLKRVQMLNRVGVRYFQDVLSLDPGARWEKELYRHIDECDLFLLFWSQAARCSEWVLKELRYAIGRKGGSDAAPPEVMPVVIEGPPHPKPPGELSHLHFNDYFLYFLRDVPTSGRARLSLQRLLHFVAWVVPGMILGASLGYAVGRLFR